MVVPCQWPSTRTKAWRTLLEARALENQLYMAGVNRCGKDLNESYGGYSRVVTPPARYWLPHPGGRLCVRHFGTARRWRSPAFNHSQLHCRSELYRLRWLGEIETREINLGR